MQTGSVICSSLEEEHIRCMSFRSGDHRFELVDARTAASGAVYFSFSHTTVIQQIVCGDIAKRVSQCVVAVLLRGRKENVFYGKFCDIKDRKMQAWERDAT